MTTGISISSTILDTHADYFTSLRKFWMDPKSAFRLQFALQVGLHGPYFAHFCSCLLSKRHIWHSGLPGELYAVNAPTTADWFCGKILIWCLCRQSLCECTSRVLSSEMARQITYVSAGLNNALAPAEFWKYDQSLLFHETLSWLAFARTWTQWSCITDTFIFAAANLGASAWV